MYNDLVRSKLEYCLEHILAIENYTESIVTPLEFIQKHNGLTYDGTLMRLQALGESLKNISIKHPQVIVDLNYSEINDVIKFRDYASHHYERLIHEIVFDIIQSDIPKLKVCLEILINKNTPSGLQ
ncbi:MAG: HepT-like ribonuclease domain-containing protein [Bacteroidia bacterium]